VEKDLQAIDVINVLTFFKNYGNVFFYLKKIVRLKLQQELRKSLLNPQKQHSWPQILLFYCHTVG